MQIRRQTKGGRFEQKPVQRARGDIGYGMQENSGHRQREGDRMDGRVDDMQARWNEMKDRIQEMTMGRM